MIDKGGTNASNILLSSYIKYDRLREICNSVLGPVQNELNGVIDIYIDLYSILYGLYTGAYNPAFDSSPNEIAAGIINMVAHYRRFFRSYNIEARVFLIYSNNYSVAKTKLVPEYNNSFEYRSRTSCNHIYNSIMYNLTLVEQICKYVANTEFISSTDTTAMMYHIMNIESKDRFRLVITKDPVTVQLAGITNRTIILRPKKTHNKETKGDTSYFISPVSNGMYHYLINERKCKAVLNNDKIISPGLYSFVLAASKVPERDMKALMSLPKVLDELLKVIELPDVLNGYNTNIQNICEKFSGKAYMNLQHGNILGRWKAIDTIYQYDSFIYTPEAKQYRGMTDLYDPNGIHDVDTKYFDKCHLNLEYL